MEVVLSTNAIDIRTNERTEQHRPVLVGVSDRDLRRAVTGTLAARGHDVVAVPDGFHLTQRIADAILGDSRSRPELIIINPILPGCTGLSLLAGLRELGWDTPVIFLIDPNDEAARDQAWSPDVSGVFVEPVDLRELSAFVELVLDPQVGDTLRSLRSPLPGGSRFPEGTNPGRG